jgi:hypothetical protein
MTKLVHYKTDEIHAGLGRLMAAQAAEPETSATARQGELA